MNSVTFSKLPLLFLSNEKNQRKTIIWFCQELSAAEIWERDRGLRKLREELRNEETKLVLLKKLKQSQQVMKENLIVTHTNASNSSNPLVEIPAALSLSSKGSLSVTPAPPPSSNLQITAHSKSNRNSSPLMR